MVILENPPGQRYGPTADDEAANGIIFTHMARLAGRRPPRRIERLAPIFGIHRYVGPDPGARQFVRIGVAAAIVARQEQAIAEGKPLDIKVVADSGIYPFGGTPNSFGVDYLEDHGISVRWAQLERTSSHDRKVHAKQILTDQGEIAGSTNFSAKGMRENWETSAYVHFEEKDPQAQALKAQSKAQFEELWEKDCYPLSVTDLARLYSKNEQADGHEHFVDSARAGATREVLTAIENYEVESGALMQRLQERPEVAAKKSQLIEQGYADGYAMLMAADAVVGQEELNKLTSALPSSIELERLQSKVERWKAKGE